MKTYVLSEVEAARADGTVLRALRAVASALNDLSSRTRAGSATMIAGTARVTVPGLQAGTRIVPGYARCIGTTGTLWANPSEYDIARQVAVIRSSSTTDGSVVSWVAVTEGV